jgi:hypothetical protein
MYRSDIVNLYKKRCVLTSDYLIDFISNVPNLLFMTTIAFLVPTLERICIPRYASFRILAVLGESLHLLIHCITAISWFNRAHHSNKEGPVCASALVGRFLIAYQQK